MEILLDIIRSVIADKLRGGVLDPVMTMLSLMGNGGAVWITLAVLLLFFRKTRRAGVAMLLALAAGYVIGNLCIKELVMRPRPFVTHSDLTALLDPGDPWSFPSGHALSSFAAATALWCFHKKTGVLALVLAALIAFSRLYASVHYPTDVLAGMLICIALAHAAAFLTDRIIDTFHSIRLRKGDK